MNSVRITLVVALTLAALRGQTGGPETQGEMSTRGEAGPVLYDWTNGRGWKVLDTQSRVTFLIGIENGMTLVLRESSDKLSVECTKRITQTVVHDLSTPGIKSSEIAQQMDDFYRDAANIKIPIVDAYKFTIKRMNGATQAELDAYVARLRKLYNR